MCENQEHDGAEYSHENAPEIKSGYACRSNDAKQEPAEERADNADNDIANNPFSMIVNDLAANESGDQPEHEPRDDRHAILQFPAYCWQELVRNDAPSMKCTLRRKARRDELPTTTNDLSTLPSNHCV